MQVKKQQLEPDMEQWTDSKLGKEYIKAVYCHPAYLTYMQSTSCEMPGWMKHKLESRLLGEISITSEDEMVGWHHQLNGPEFEQALGVGDGQGSLACCSPWGCKQLDTAERLN